MDCADLVELARRAGLPFLGDPPAVTGADPVFEYPVPIGEASALVHALESDGATSVATARALEFAPAALGVRHAAASLASFALLRLEGRPDVPEQWEQDASGTYRPWGAEAVLRGENAGNPVVAFHRCRDGRWIHLHGGTPRLAARIHSVLGRSAVNVPAAVARWASSDLEDAIAAAASCAVVARTPEEWSNHPQGWAIAALAPCVIERVAEAPPLVLAVGGPLPLSGVNVLDLGDGLAGPTAAQALGRYGADVLQVVAPGRAFVEPFVLDTGHGKRSATVDLTTTQGRAVFAALVAGADVVCHSFRPGALERFGFSADVMRSLSAGLVHVSINCYGPVGPWRGRRGWEQLGQAATGLALAASTDGRPRLAPAAVCDYLTGHWAAVGALRALATRAISGGTFDVRASLCQTGSWLGTLRKAPSGGLPASVGAFDDLLVREQRGQASITHLPPVVQSALLPAGWRWPAPVRGADRAEWTAKP